MAQGFPIQASMPTEHRVFVRLKGAGAAAPTKDAGGEGVTVTRQGVGLYSLVLSEVLGKYMGAFAKHAPVTLAAAGEKDVIVDHDSYTDTARTLAIQTATKATDAAAAAAYELTTNDFVYIELIFRRSNVSG